MAVDAPRLIGLLGAESTGKTTLARALARHFDGLWVPEALRHFCDQHARTPRRDEQAGILQAQVTLQDAALQQAAQQGVRYVFCDTAPLLTAVYSAHYFADTSLYPRARALQSRYTLTLLLSPDLPWAPDGLHRDGRQAQTAVHALLARECAALTRVVRVQGSGALRLQAAVDAVNAIQTLAFMGLRPPAGP